MQGQGGCSDGRTCERTLFGCVPRWQERCSPATANKGGCVRELQAPIAPKPPQGVLVRGHDGLVINKLSLGYGWEDSPAAATATWARYTLFRMGILSKQAGQRSRLLGQGRDPDRILCALRRFLMVKLFFSLTKKDL